MQGKFSLSGHVAGGQQVVCAGTFCGHLCSHLQEAPGSAVLCGHLCSHLQEVPGYLTKNRRESPSHTTCALLVFQILIHCPVILHTFHVVSGWSTPNSKQLLLVS